MSSQYPSQHWPSSLSHFGFFTMLCARQGKQFHFKKSSNQRKKTSRVVLSTQEFEFRLLKQYEVSNNGTIPSISPTIKKDPRVVVFMSFSHNNKNVSLNTDFDRLSATYSDVSHGMRRLVSFMFCVLQVQASCGVLMVMQFFRITLAILPSPKHI